MHPQWNDVGALFQTFSYQNPNIDYERLLLQWLNYPYHLCRGRTPVTKVVFDFLISVVEDPHFIACVLWGLSMKGLYFSDQSTLHQLRKALFQLSVISPYFLDQNPPLSWEGPLLQWSKFPYIISKDKAAPTGRGVFRYCRITISYIKIPKFELINSNGCFTRL